MLMCTGRKWAEVKGKNEGKIKREKEKGIEKENK